MSVQYWCMQSREESNFGIYWEEIEKKSGSKCICLSEMKWVIQEYDWRKSVLLFIKEPNLCNRTQKAILIWTLAERTKRNSKMNTLVTSFKRNEFTMLMWTKRDVLLKVTIVINMNGNVIDLRLLHIQFNNSTQVFFAPSLLLRLITNSIIVKLTRMLLHLLQSYYW
jgi:hypothetical protein